MPNSPLPTSALTVKPVRHVFCSLSVNARPSSHLIPPPSTPVASRSHGHGSRAQTVAFFVGGFGVLSGFAIFLLMLERADQPVLFLIILGVASVLSAIFEGLKEQIEGHHAPHEPQKSTARYFVFLSILAVAEFNVMSWEAVTQVSASHELETVVHSLIGSPVVEPTTPSVHVSTTPVAVPANKGNPTASLQTSRHPPLLAPGQESAFRVFVREFLDVTVLIGFWVLTGAILPVALLSRLKSDTGPLPRRLFRGGSAGALTGAIVAPICLLVYVLVVWLARGAAILVKPQLWTANVEALRDLAAGSHNFVSGLFALVLSGMLRAVGWFGGHVFGPAAVVLGAIAAVVFLVKNKVVFPAIIVGAAIVAVVIAPLWASSAAIPPMLLRASLVWVVPGLVLGTMSPLLRETSEERKPKAWALVAFASATVLFVLTVLRFDRGWWLLLPAVLFLAMGVALRRSTDPQSYWLPMAVAMSVLVGGTMLGVQKAASFVGVYDSMHGIVTLPSEIKPFAPSPLSATLANFASALPTLRMQASNLEAWTDINLPVSERIRRARVSQITLEGMQRELDRVKIDPAEWQHKMAEPQRKIDGLTDMETKWFARLESTIEANRELAKLGFDVEEQMRGPLRELRAAVVAVTVPIIGLADAGALTKGSSTTAQEQERMRVETAVRDGRRRLLAQIDAELSEAAAIETKIESQQTALRKTEKEMRDTMMRWLELAIAGSVGFWTAISLLVGWSMERTANGPGPEGVRP